MADKQADTNGLWFYIDSPWNIQYNKFGQYEVIDKHGVEITVIDAYDNDAATYQASIISAAPEMLLLLKRLQELQMDHEFIFDLAPVDFQDAVRKVILKAEWLEGLES